MTPIGLTPNETLIGQVVGGEERHALILIQTQFMSCSERVYWHIRELLEPHDADGFRTYLSGGPALAASLTS